MSCFSTESELVDLLDGRLDAARELAVHAHLEGCADCRRRVHSEQYRKRHQQELRVRAIRRYYERLGRPVPVGTRVIRYPQ